MARNHQNLGGVYANMDFPPYTYIEYPKHIIVGPHGQTKIVQNAEEEKVLKAAMQKEHDDAPPAPLFYAADPEKDILISRANELGVPINTKWSKAKLEQVVKAAEDEIDNLPAEGQEFDYTSPAVISVEESTDDKEELIAEAKSLGIDGKNFHLWGVPRLKAAIAEVKSK